MKNIQQDMTLRDYFAAKLLSNWHTPQVLVKTMLTHNIDDPEHGFTLMANMIWNMADTMIKTREASDEN